MNLPSAVNKMLLDYRYPVIENPDQYIIRSNVRALCIDLKNVVKTLQDTIDEMKPIIDPILADAEILIYRMEHDNEIFRIFISVDELFKIHNNLQELSYCFRYHKPIVQFEHIIGKIWDMTENFNQ